MVAVRQSLDQFTFTPGEGVTSVQNLTGPLTDDNLLVLFITVDCASSSARRVSSITQAGATWVQAGESFSGTSTDHRCEVWYAEGISSAAAAITVTLNTGQSIGAGYDVMEYSGCLTSGALDVTLANEDTANPNQVGANDTGAVIAQGDALVLWATSSLAVSGSLDRYQFEFDAIAPTRAFGSFMLSGAEMTRCVRHRIQGKARSNNISTNANVIVSFNTLLPSLNSVVRVQQVSREGSVGAGPFSRVLLFPPTPGNTLLCFLSLHADITVTSITQTNVTWVLLTADNVGVPPSGIRHEVWIGSVGASPSDTLSVAVSFNTQIAFETVEYSGLTANDISVLDTTDTNSGTGTTSDTGLGTLTGQAIELIIASHATRFGDQAGADFHSPINNFSLNGNASGGSSGSQHGVAVCDFGAEAAGQFQSQLTIPSQEWHTILLGLEAIATITIPPAVSAENPAQDAANIPQRDTILFHVGGADGVDQTTIDVDIQIGSATFIAAMINGVAQFPYNDVSSSIVSQGDGFDVVIDYRGRFPKGEPITVRINASNDFGFAMNQVQYIFTTDNTVPDPVELLQIAQG